MLVYWPYTANITPNEVVWRYEYATTNSRAAAVAIHLNTAPVPPRQVLTVDYSRLSSNEPFHYRISTNQNWSTRMAMKKN